VTSKFISVSGLINDIVRGTVSEGQANVTVNGKAASVSNRSYLADNIELIEGVNTLTIQGADQVGNTSTVHSTVTYKVPVRSTLSWFRGKVSGRVFARRWGKPSRSSCWMSWAMQRRTRRWCFG